LKPASASQVVSQATGYEANVVVHPVFLSCGSIIFPPINVVANAIERQILGGRIDPSIDYLPTLFHVSLLLLGLFVWTMAGRG
jgi:hypothetical protein